MKREFTTDGIYHIVSRGVDKRKIFMDEKDYVRFIHDLFEFNDTVPTSNTAYFLKNNNNDIASRYIDRGKEKRKRELLVEILAFCLMPNHYHLLLKPRFDDGIVKFMKKLNIGYAKYFNKKYERTGALFGSRYKSIQIQNDPHFTYIPYYIHLNPLDFKFPEWRKGEIKNYKEAMNFLENYRWSSFLDYIGKKNFPSVTQREFLNEYFDGPENYKKETEQWLKNLNSVDVDDIFFE